MNNKEAAKALLAGKTLRIIKSTSDVNLDLIYKFNSDVLCIESSSGFHWHIREFTDDTEWEEVKEPYKKEHIVVIDDDDDECYYCIDDDHNMLFSDLFQHFGT
jgi:hypothetical protein